MLVFEEDDMKLPFMDPWIGLTAIAANTKRIKLGPLITPLPRRRPWKLARECVTLDYFSNGRLILGLAIGAPPKREFTDFGEVTDPKIRAEMLDEGLDILIGLWTGETFSFNGKHYDIEEMTFLPAPKQKPRIPIWIGGGWPHIAPFRRAAKYDGVAPVHSAWPETLNPSHVEDIVKIIQNERGNLDCYDVVVCGETSGTDSTKDSEIISSWVDVGASWWLEDIHGIRADIEKLRERIKNGPPSF
jgi:alkanesulfonate monooxygenase SsuD/methylene tetrahydromethanopterin reductase-like flavin-dependent oxidoreductase (luciferase family)